MEGGGADEGYFDRWEHLAFLVWAWLNSDIIERDRRSDEMSYKREKLVAMRKEGKNNGPNEVVGCTEQ